MDNKTTKANGDEVLYMDEIHGRRVARPPTSNVEMVPLVHSIPPIDLRADFSSEVNEESLRRTSVLSRSEMDERNDEKASAEPMPGIGFDRNGLPSMQESNWLNRALPTSSSTVQLVTPDVNVYQQKKTLAQGMMDLALLSANANQMRYVLQTDGNHPYFYPSLVLISMSLFLQIAVGIGLIWNSVYNVKEHEQMCKANKANNWTVIGIFLVTIFNVFISSFGVVDQVQPTVTS